MSRRIEALLERINKDRTDTMLRLLEEQLNRDYPRLKLRLKR